MCDRGGHHPLKPLIPLKGERPYSITVNRLQLIQQTVIPNIPKVYVSEKKKTPKDQQLRNFNINSDKQSVEWIIIYTETDNPVVVMLRYTRL